MRLSRLLALSLCAVGSAGSARVLRRRYHWEQGDNRVAICVDYDDAYSAAVRAGLPFDAMLDQMARHGATHLSLPELSLQRLLRTGELCRQGPAEYPERLPGVGHWNFLAGAPGLVTMLASELQARLPFGQAHVREGHVLTFAGEMETISQVGLGFDGLMAARIQHHGLAVLPRPTSYDWPDDDLINLTLAQAAVFGRLVAFDTPMILGHELHLHTTFTAMKREGLSFVYFAESRHQKGDWFMAKRLAPRVIIGHQLSPADMIPLDYAAAARHWAVLARERGVRLCYINFFRVLHAAEPLEGLAYVAEVKRVLSSQGFEVTQKIGWTAAAPGPNRQELALAGLAAAGAGAAAVTAALELPEALALPMTVAAAAGSAALPYFERARSHLEEQYPPSYAPKLLALSASLAPAAALGAGPGEWAQGLAFQAAAALALAVATSGADYYLRVEEFRGFNLHWAIPLAAALQRLPQGLARNASLGLLALGWAALTRRGADPLAQFDLSLAETHTHHLSTATRIIGDVQIALGPRPGRKWTGAGAFGAAVSLALARSGRARWAAAAAVVGAAGNVLGLSSWRRPERPLRVTAREALVSFGAGVLVGALLLRLTGDAGTAET